jgi:hypothetical protein
VVCKQSAQLDLEAYEIIHSPEKVAAVLKDPHFACTGVLDCRASNDLAMMTLSFVLCACDRALLDCQRIHNVIPPSR